MKPFVAVSASQIETYDTCKRKWFLNKIVGLPTPQHASAALGEAVHKGQEKFLEDDAVTDVHPLARGSLPLLRELRGKVLVEHGFERVLRRGTKFVGRIDVLDFKCHKNPRIIDWKTTSNMAYAKTSEELRASTQMMAYAHEALLLDINATVVTVAHAVIPTRAGQFRYTDADLTAKEIRDGWVHIQDKVDMMITTSKEENPNDVEPTLSACKAFGGCPFADRCAAFKTLVADPYAALDTNTPEDNNMPTPSYAALLNMFTTDANIMTNMKMSVDELNAIKAAAGKPATILPPEVANPAPVVATPAPAAAPATTATTATTVRSVWEPADFLAAGWSKEQVNAMLDEVFDEVAANNWKPAEVDIETENGESGDIVAVKPKPAPAPAPVVVAEPVKPARRDRLAAPVETPAPAVEVKQDVIAPAAEPVVEEPRRRGRPPGAKNKATLEAEAAAAQTPDAATAANPNIEQQVVAAEAPASRVVWAGGSAAHTTGTEYEMQKARPFVLYIDCAPEGFDNAMVQHLDAVLVPFMKMAAEKNKNEKTGAAEPLTHYSLIPFGKGPAVVSSYMLANISHVTVGALVVDSRSPCAAACIEILRPLANVVVSARGR